MVIKNVLVATDFSPSSESALAYGRELARQFASRLHVEDLKRVEAEVGIRYELEAGAHYQDLCPGCRRKNLALVQGGFWRAASGSPSGGGD